MPKKKTETTEAPQSAATAQAAPIVAYKGFDEAMRCRGFAYEFGATYTHQGDVVPCESGFHACEHPLNVFSYYPPATSRYAIVEMSGKIAREKNGDTKIAAAEITIRAEISLPDLIQSAVKYVFDRVKWIDGLFAEGEALGVRATKNGGAATASGEQGAATASGDRGAATASGWWGAATASGWWGAATASGDWGAATASGDRGAATASGVGGAATASGDRGAATASGDWGAATASGRWGAATASGVGGAATASGVGGAATASGVGGAATASGEQGAATASGDRGAATASGDRGAATASGHGGKVRGHDGNALFLVERNADGSIAHVWAGIAGRGGIAADTWYTLRDGKPVEVAALADDDED